MILFKNKLYISCLIILLVADCIVGAWIAEWRSAYWQSLIDKQFQLWMFYIGQFIIAALISCGISGWSQYLGNIIGLHYRTKLTRKALKLNNFNAIEGGAQRIQEDCLMYPQLFLRLATEGIKAFVMIFVFATIILIQLPFWYAIIGFVYAIIGTLLATKIAKPLINLNYLNQVFEARFRSLLQKLSDKIQKYKTSYVDVHQNNIKMFRRLKVLQYFQSFYNQITIIIPHLLLLFVYFSGKITFGVFMQLASSFAELINNLSFFINSFDMINKWLSCKRRLKELNII